MCAPLKIGKKTVLTLLPPYMWHTDYLHQHAFLNAHGLSSSVTTRFGHQDKWFSFHNFTVSQLLVSPLNWTSLDLLSQLLVREALAPGQAGAAAMSVTLTYFAW